MSIVQQQMPIYNITVHENMNNIHVALNVAKNVGDIKQQYDANVLSGKHKTKSIALDI